MNCSFCIVRDLPAEQGGGILGVYNPNEPRPEVAFSPLLFKRSSSASKVAHRLSNHTGTKFDVTVCDQDTGKVFSPAKASRLMSRCVADVTKGLQRLASPRPAPAAKATCGEGENPAPTY